MTVAVYLLSVLWGIYVLWAVGSVVEARFAARRDLRKFQDMAQVSEETGILGAVRGTGYMGRRRFGVGFVPTVWVVRRESLEFVQYGGFGRRKVKRVEATEASVTVVSRGVQPYVREESTGAALAADSKRIGRLLPALLAGGYVRPPDDSLPGIFP